jgi:hypothetical protein
MDIFRNMKSIHPKPKKSLNSRHAKRRFEYFLWIACICTWQTADKKRQERFAQLEKEIVMLRKLFILIAVACGVSVAPAAFAQSPSPNRYETQVQWDGNDAPWHPNGTFVMAGGRDNRPLVAIHVSSPDGGKSLVGKIHYAGEAPIGFTAAYKGDNMYATQVQRDNAQWHPNGTFVFGGRDRQRVIEINAASPDGGMTLSGNMRYSGESAIGFRARYLK